MAFEEFEVSRKKPVKRGVIFRMNGKDRKHATIYFSAAWMEDNNAYNNQDITFFFDSDKKLVGFRLDKDPGPNSFKFSTGHHGGAEVADLWVFPKVS